MAAASREKSGICAENCRETIGDNSIAICESTSNMQIICLHIIRKLFPSFAQHIC